MSVPAGDVSLGGGSLLLGLAFALLGAMLVLASGQGTRGAAVAGFGTAAAMVLGFGAPVMAPVALFVLGGGALTRLGRERKERASAAEPNRGRRGVSNVVAKLGLPALLGLAAAVARGGAREALAVATVASLAGAFADTAATEVGPLAMGRVVRIEGARLRRAGHGDPGGVSLAGLLAAAAAAAALAFASWAAGMPGRPAASGIAAASGLVSTLAESALMGTAAGRGLGHFGRNVFVSSCSAAVAVVTALAAGAITLGGNS
ncbi:MAG TPA: DUF92 domain-containing protein [Candidatus Eisenbacteria bacterium]